MIDKMTSLKWLNILHKLVGLVQSKYTFPDIWEKIAVGINERIFSGVYDDKESLPELCTLLTAQLQELSQDKHLQVSYSKDVLPAGDEDGKIDMWERHKQTIEEYNFGFTKVERLQGNIGYLDLRALYPPEMAAESCNAAMTFLSKTNAMILDLRFNSGGAPEMVRTLLSYFFPSASVHLNTFHWREGGRTQEMWTLPVLPGPRYLNKPVYVLTSANTFSGAEECAYDLQQLQRATVLGEVTKGGAHPGDQYRLDDHVHAFIPNGLLIHPITGTDWEGIGVKPDIEVPAEDAFNAAYKLALGQLLTSVEQRKLMLTNRTLNEIKVELGGRYRI